MLRDMARNKKIPNLRQVLGRNIVATRRMREMTQERLGELADLHPTYISSVENYRRNVSIDAIERIAKALKVPPSELLKD
jgi:transcriptional regulator with XRE-family HTH domain